MEKLLYAGIAFIAASIVGSGLKAFGIEISAISSLKRQILLAIFGGVLIIVYCIILYFNNFPQTETKKNDAAIVFSEPIPFTAFPGDETSPTLSPDGSIIAFSWDKDTTGHNHIFIKTKQESSALQITNNQLSDHSPSWSPDGQNIAFIRNPGKSGKIFLISPTGLNEHQVGTSEGTLVKWIPNDKTNRYVAISDRGNNNEPYSNISVIDLLDNNNKRILIDQLTDNPICHAFCFSNNGTQIAFLKGCDIWIGDISYKKNFPEVTKKWQLTFGYKLISNICWMPDKDYLIFSSDIKNGSVSLFKIQVRPNAKSQKIEIGESIGGADIVRNKSTNVMAFEKYTLGFNIWRYKIETANRLAEPYCIAPSNRYDLNPQYSPDSKSICFASDRAGQWDIYLCDINGGNLKKLTQNKSYAGSPRWSPDGQTIVFDATDSLSRNIYTVDKSGFPIIQLTTDLSEEARPSFSRDGTFIYFMSDRSGLPQIWKVPAKGGKAIQITKNGGFEPYESYDGKFLYYVKKFNSQGLWELNLETNKERMLLDSVVQGKWNINKFGVYYIDFNKISVLDKKPIKFYNFLKKKTSVIGFVERNTQSLSIGLSIDALGKYLLVIQQQKQALTDIWTTEFSN